LIQYIYGLRKQEAAEGLGRPIGLMTMLLAGSIEKPSDAGIE
jgi:hypothetical protein